jgi:hypothetical protein
MRTELSGMSTLTARCLIALSMLLSALDARAAPTAVPAARAVPRPAVVELYTSQGCSSCPPADALLGELKSHANVLALAFHVGYWDELGWSDRFALPYADQRQSRYARALKLSSVFTPQLVVDGQRSFVGSDRGSILPALTAERSGVAIAIQPDGAALRIDVAAGAPGVATGDVLLLALLPEAQTAIGRGENGGRTLREFNIVRASFPLGTWDGSAHRYSLPRSSLPADASMVAVLLQQTDQRSILGATLYAWP